MKRSQQCCFFDFIQSEKCPISSYFHAHWCCFSFPLESWNEGLSRFLCLSQRAFLALYRIAGNYRQVIEDFFRLYFYWNFDLFSHFKHLSDFSLLFQNLYFHMFVSFLHYCNHSESCFLSLDRVNMCLNCFIGWAIQKKLNFKTIIHMDFHAEYCFLSVSRCVRLTCCIDFVLKFYLSYCYHFRIF